MSIPGFTADVPLYHPGHHGYRGESLHARIGMPMGMVLPAQWPIPGPIPPGPALCSLTGRAFCDITGQQWCEEVCTWPAGMFTRWRECGWCR